MSTNPRKRGGISRQDRLTSRTTADATPALAGVIEAMSAGSALDEQVGRSFARVGRKMYTPGLSTTWVGAQELVEALTALGYYVEFQLHATRCLCRVLRVLKGNVVSKQLAGAEGETLPEAAAKAALLTLMEIEPPAV